jgi:hypothetical protein
MHLFEGASLAPASVAHLFESELKEISFRQKANCQCLNKQKFLSWAWLEGKEIGLNLTPMMTTFPDKLGVLCEVLYRESVCFGLFANWENVDEG